MARILGRLQFVGKRTIHQGLALRRRQGSLVARSRLPEDRHCPGRQQEEVGESLHISNFSWRASAIPPCPCGALWRAALLRLSLYALPRFIQGTCLQ